MVWTINGFIILAYAVYRWLTGNMENYMEIVICGGLQLATGAILMAIDDLREELKSNEEV